jgi:hypothetical protein
MRRHVIFYIAFLFIFRVAECLGGRRRVIRFESREVEERDFERLPDALRTETMKVREEQRNRDVRDALILPNMSGVRQFVILLNDTVTYQYASDVLRHVGGAVSVRVPRNGIVVIGDDEVVREVIRNNDSMVFVGYLRPEDKISMTWRSHLSDLDRDAARRVKIEVQVPPLTHGSFSEDGFSRKVRLSLLRGLRSRFVDTGMTGSVVSESKVVFSVLPEDSRAVVEWLAAQRVTQKVSPLPRAELFNRWGNEIIQERSESRTRPRFGLPV